MIDMVHIARLPISLPCPVPVFPGTPDTMRDGEAIPMEERTEKCCVDAFWMLGAQITCDVHLRVACELMDIDYEGLLDEAAEMPGYSKAEMLAAWREREAVPWAERHRYAQEDAGS